MSDPVMKPRYNISLAEERQLALDRLQRICDNGFISVLDFRDNPLRIFAAHELAAIIGLSQGKCDILSLWFEEFGLYKKIFICDIL